ncbi:MAG: cobalamin-dependent protein [Phycisphaeraceae bacterium]|nr:cobalamin-dependent protein [Phycisphaeraceae bacterium]
MVKHPTSAFAAEFIRASAKAMAIATYDGMTQTDQSLQSRWGQGANLWWRVHIESILEHLAAAVSSDEPGIMLAHLTWTRDVMEARGLGQKDQELCLNTLARVLADTMRDIAGGAATRMFDEARSACSAATASDLHTPRIDPQTPLGRIAGEYLIAVLEGRPDDAADLILSQVQRGVSPADLYLRVLTPAQEEVGRMWAVGDLHVGEEHVISNVTSQVLARLSALISRQGRRTGRRVLASAVQGNTHEIGIRIVADFFEMAGWTCVYLGADTPIDDLVRSAQDFQVDLVALSVGMAPQIEACRESIAHLRHTPDTSTLPVIVGGRPFASSGDLWKKIGADAYARSPDEAVTLGERLLSNHRVNGTSHPS